MSKKISINPKPYLFPLPAVMVSCGSTVENQNIITISWTGVISSVPPTVYVSIRPERFSHAIIKEEKEFVINLTTKDLLEETDFCGVKSGRNLTKFKEADLTAIPAQKVACPLIAEAPVNLECKVKKVENFGSHDAFIAEVVAINISEEFIDLEKGKIFGEKLELISYSFGSYRLVRDILGKSGFSVRKK